MPKSLSEKLKDAKARGYQHPTYSAGGGQRFNPNEIFENTGLAAEYGGRSIPGMYPALAEAAAPYSTPGLIAQLAGVNLEGRSIMSDATNEAMGRNELLRPDGRQFVPETPWEKAVSTTTEVGGDILGWMTGAKMLQGGRSLARNTGKALDETREFNQKVLGDREFMENLPVDPSKREAVKIGAGVAGIAALPMVGAKMLSKAAPKVAKQADEIRIMPYDEWGMVKQDEIEKQILKEVENTPYEQYFNDMLMGRVSKETTPENYSKYVRSFKGELPIVKKGINRVKDMTKMHRDDILNKIDGTHYSLKPHGLLQKEALEEINKIKPEGVKTNEFVDSLRLESARKEHAMDQRSIEQSLIMSREELFNPLPYNSQARKEGKFFKTGTNNKQVVEDNWARGNSPEHAYQEVALQKQVNYGDSTLGNAPSTRIRLKDIEKEYAKHDAAMGKFYSKEQLEWMEDSERLIQLEAIGKKGHPDKGYTYTGGDLPTTVNDLELGVAKLESDVANIEFPF